MKSMTTTLFVLLILTALTFGLRTALGDDDDDDARDWLRRESIGFAPPANPLYVEECGDCHMAYPPGLLPGASWKRIMSGLEDHFGDNAELDPAVQRKLTAYLIAHSAERSHLRRARAVMRSVGDSAPLRITETRWFRHEHDEIPARWVKGNDEVRRFSQCDACHRDAARGRFDEDNVVIPGHGRWDD